MERKHEILIVDDSVDLVSNLRDILEEAGYNVTDANDGQTALTLCRDKEFVLGQLVNCLKGVNSKDIGSLTIAYEPIWAIGTGKTATSEDANDMCGAIREKILEIYGEQEAEAVRIQYGGSVKPSNISELMSMPDIDGALVGGASLKADDFLAIINY